VIIEFGKDIEVVVTNKEGKHKSFKISDLLPGNFSPV